MRIKHVKWVLVVIMFLIQFYGPLPSSGDQNGAEKGKVAIVNGVVITQDILDREMVRYQQGIQSTEKALDDSQLSSIKKQALENIIGAELLYQESQKKGIKVDETEVDKQFEEIKKQYSSESEFQDLLKKMNLNETTVKSYMITRGLAIKELIDKEIIQKVVVSDEETKAYYDNNAAIFKQPELVKASHILIKVDPKGDESQKKASLAKIEEIQEKVRKGEDFAALAREYSQGPSNVKGGDLGYFSRDQMVKPFSDAAFLLKIGDVSGIVETEYGYHLIKVTDRKDETPLDLEVVKDRLQQVLRQDKARKNMEQYVAELREKAKVEILIEENL